MWIIQSMGYDIKTDYVNTSKFMRGSYSTIDASIHCCLCSKCEDHGTTQTVQYHSHHYYMLCKLHLLTEGK